MNGRTSLKILGALILGTLISLSTPVFADQGKDMRYGESGCGGAGWKRHHMGPGAPGRGMRLNLSDEASAAATKERDAFREATEPLRRQIRQKKLELQAELAKETPDAGKAVQIQKEISELKADFDARRIEHRLRMKKIHPDLGQGFGHKAAMRSRGSGRGPCWE